jgi:hypothetical protein
MDAEPWLIGFIAAAAIVFHALIVLEAFKTIRRINKQ